jgi:NADH pyrophosphatase NudC (nudix superfamily)
MDKFQTELLAQLKEHNRLTKELVKIERANLELSKNANNVNSRLADIVIPQNHNAEISSEVKPKPAHWIYEYLDGTISSRCSNCGRTTYYYRVKWEYCPNCGMPMEIEKEGEENA